MACMSKNIKDIIKAVMPLKYHHSLMRIKDWLGVFYFTKSYAQEGEDMILRRIFETQETGFYVDVGAHHPKRFSNTYHFYKSGWRGINIDAMPGSMSIFNKIRPRDINLEAAISSKKSGKLTYYAFSESALNSFSKELSLQRDGERGNKIIFTKELETVSLKDILNRYIPQNTQVDFLSVDVEGLEMEVLRSNDWSKYKPRIVLVEQLMTSVEEVERSEIRQFMRDQGYLLYAKTANSVFYLLR